MGEGGGDGRYLVYKNGIWSDIVSTRKNVKNGVNSAVALSVWHLEDGTTSKRAVRGKANYFLLSNQAKMLSGYRLKASSNRKKVLMRTSFNIFSIVQRKGFSFRIPLVSICFGLFFFHWVLWIGESPKEKLTFTSGRQMPVVCYQIAHAAIGLSFLGCVRRLCHTQLTASWHLRNPLE